MYDMHRIRHGMRNREIREWFKTEAGSLSLNRGITYVIYHIYVGFDYVLLFGRAFHSRAHTFCDDFVFGKHRKYTHTHTSQDLALRFAGVFSVKYTCECAYFW